MELTNDFRVPVPIDRAWEILTDVERIAPCMPGAELQEVAGDEYRGVVKVKVGPITAQYKGAASFQEKDDTGHRAVLKAEGRETRGQGNASATITATLTPDGDGTKVTLATDLTITGKVAQFGRGVLGDVTTKLIGQFVDCLEADVLSGSGSSGNGNPGNNGDANAVKAAEVSATANAAPEVRRIEGPTAAPVNLIDTAGAPVAKRLAPLVAILFLLTWLLRRRRRSR